MVTDTTQHEAQQAHVSAMKGTKMRVGFSGRQKKIRVRIFSLQGEGANYVDTQPDLVPVITSILGVVVDMAHKRQLDLREHADMARFI